MMKSHVKRITLIFLLALSTNVHAESFNVCVGIKNLCVETVKFFTDPVSKDRINGLLECQQTKADCNDFLTALKEDIQELTGQN